MQHHDGERHEVHPKPANYPRCQSEVLRKQQRRLATNAVRAAVDVEQLVVPRGAEPMVGGEVQHREGDRHGLQPLAADSPSGQSELPSREVLPPATNSVYESVEQRVAEVCNNCATTTGTIEQRREDEAPGSRPP